MRVGEEQGIAGLSFASGLKVESFTRDSLNANFSPAMIEAWETDFASLVAVPVHAGGTSNGERYWVPVGVVVATSSIATTVRASSESTGGREPCWRKRPALLGALREVGERLLIRNS